MLDRNVSNRAIVRIGMFAAILSVLSIMAIPMPSGVPITLQTFAVALCGYVLGAKQGAVTVGIYLLLGAVGMPVFSGMRGGVSLLVSHTGGFLWGFLFLAMFCGIAAGRKDNLHRIICSGVGLLICHILGILQFAMVTDVGIVPAFLMVSAPYLIKDIILVTGAYMVAGTIRKQRRDL